jgi:serpin B
MITDFMHTMFLEYDYYEGADFSAVTLGLSGDHQMWLILPQEGRSAQELLERSDYYDLISHPDTWEQPRRVTLNLSMPKFDVSNEQNLIPGLKAMGITDVFSTETADFSPLSDTELYLSKASHAARVAADEAGVIAAAYTLMVGDTGGMPEQLEEVDFILDRPFLFVITGSDNFPLFAGVVAEP